MQVKTILDTKGHEFWSVGPQTSVYDAVRLMAEKEVGSVLVLENGKVQGIVTERDYARKVVLEGKTSPDTPVAEIMTTQVLCTRPEQTIEEAMALAESVEMRDPKRIAAAWLAAGAAEAFEKAKDWPRAAEAARKAEQVYRRADHTTEADEFEACAKENDAERECVSSVPVSTAD